MTVQTEPNWERLQELTAEREALMGRGEWTRANFDRLLAEAEEAVGPDGQEFLECILNWESSVTD